MLSTKSYYLFFVIILFCISPGYLVAQGQDKLPVREYTNPQEMVRFDRSASFVRALDVINQFSQEYRGKVIIDRTGTDGTIGISIPPMHWKDALNLILNVKGLVLLEQKDFYEIVTRQSLQRQDQGYTQGQTALVGDTLKATTSTKEIRINAIFFEGNKRALREVGVDWSTISQNVPDQILTGGQGQGGGSGGGGGGGQGGGQQQGPQIPNPIFQPDGPFVQVNSKGAQSVSQDVFSSLINFGEIGTSGIEVQALFSAFEADNLGEILSSPSVKVVDGQAGRIQVGQDFSIKQRDFAGNVTDDFFSVGTILEVTPTVIEQRDTTFIHLDINAERSSAIPDPVSTVINKSVASTQSILLDGESTVIAGLYRTEQTEVRRGIPILKDLPSWFFGLRYLFGYNSEDSQTRELVVLIQATIEPSVPERYANRKNLPGKFNVLERERNRTKDEFARYSKSDMLDSRDTSDEKSTDEASGGTEMQEMKKDSASATAKVENTPTQEKPDADKKEAMSDTGEMKQEKPPVTDPEVSTKSVPLDFSEDKKEQDKAPADSDSSKTENTQQTPNPVSDSVSEKASSTSTNKLYYIIAGSFEEEGNASNYKDQLVDEGYDAVILQKPGSSFSFVAYDGYSSLSSAQSALSDIKQYKNDGAWIYKRK